MAVRILILYDNAGAQVEAMAQAIGEGVGRIEGAEAIIRDTTSASAEDLLDSDGIILGSPNWNGITGRLKMWLDDMSDMGQEGLLEGKMGGPSPQDGAVPRGRSSPSSRSYTGCSPLE
jgi:NAD(P)H dehydrogenase (quinone)